MRSVKGHAVRHVTCHLCVQVVHEVVPLLGVSRLNRFVKDIAVVSLVHIATSSIAARCMHTLMIVLTRWLVVDRRRARPSGSTLEKLEDDVKQV